MSTTPVMLFTIVSVTANGQGRHQKHGLVHNLRDTLAILVWDEAMMIFGLLHATLMDRAYAWVLEWAASACLAMVFKGIGEPFAAASRQRRRHTRSIHCASSSA